MIIYDESDYMDFEYILQKKTKELRDALTAVEDKLAIAMAALRHISCENYTAQILNEDNATEEEQIKAWSRDSIDRQTIATQALADLDPKPTIPWTPRKFA